MIIAFFDNSSKEEQTILKQKLKGNKLLFFKEAIQKVPRYKFAKAQVINVFIHSKLNEELLKRLPNLQAIITSSTGFDHIDIHYCKKHHIQVGNVPFYGENTVAEHAFALMLNLSRNVHKSYMRTKENDFSIKGLRGFDLKGKTLGVLGVGRIGLHVIRMAKAFGMHVKAYDINQDSFISEILHFQYASFDEIIKDADILTLHMPLTRTTKHILNRKTLSKTKKGVIIINTARGGLIDTKALYDLLKSKHIGGAGLDVIEGEEYIAHEDELLANDNTNAQLQVFLDEKIFDMENVIFTPHNAFNSKEAIERIFATTLENIEEYLENKEIKYSVIKH